MTAKSYKKKLFSCTFLILCSSIILLTACSTITKKKNQKPIVITTLFPQYDFVKQIAKNKVSVKLLLPPGVEAHSFEPTPKDIVAINNCDLLIFTNEQMEPWIYKFANKKYKQKPLITKASSGIKLIKLTSQSYDPHVWLNPLNAQLMANNILNSLTAIDPKNADFYKKNADKYKQKLSKLDTKIQTALKKSRNKTIFHGGHFTFRYFAKQYNLEYISPYAGASPNSEPTPKSIALMIDKMKTQNAKYIFFGELIVPKVAKTISQETGSQMLLLHGLHNVSKEELDNEITYISTMENNLKNLLIGLGND